MLEEAERMRKVVVEGAEDEKLFAPEVEPSVHSVSFCSGAVDLETLLGGGGSWMDGWMGGCLRTRWSPWWCTP